MWALLLVSLGTACASEDVPPTAGEVLPDGVDYAIHQMRTFLTREGVRRARVEADTAEFHGEDEVHLRPLTLTFFDDAGRESTVVTADSGIYYERTENMDAEGSVVAVDRAEGQRLETERLRYVNAEDRLYGDTTFRLYRDNGLTMIDGASFESDPSLDSVIVETPSGQTDRAIRRASPPTPNPALETDPDSGLLDVPGSDPGALADPTDPDSAGTPIDTATTVPDSIEVSSDSSRVVGDTTGAPPDTSSARRRADPGQRGTGRPGSA